jgi:lipopolysaccharide transport system ATP-binding protein
LLNKNGTAEAQLTNLNGNERDTIWALRNVSFEVKHGAIIGFIGRNGAGKSTLLKVISRITEPTEGRVTITGRVGSLLEVGTGFHSELTGRENVYLSGAVLGMTRHEIQNKFDQIVDFAEVEKFIDTPVKRYSSGMYVRLAFSVVAHLDPEILIVDEVLAVGDLAFQVKCLNKMHEIRQQGKTILFVSHNMETISRLCSQVLLLNGGSILKSGSPTDVIPLYLKSFDNLHAERTWDSGEQPGNDIVRLKSARIRNLDGNTTTVADIRFPIGIEIEYDVLTPGVILIPNFHFCNVEGLQLFVLQDVRSEWRSTPRPIGRYRSVAWIPGNFLAEGSMAVDIAISTHIPKTAIHIFDRRSVGFQVVDSFDGNSARGDYSGQMPGLIRPLMEWNTVIIDSCRESLERERELG